MKFLLTLSVILGFQISAFAGDLVARGEGLCLVTLQGLQDGDSASQEVGRYKARVSDPQACSDLGNAYLQLHLKSAGRSTLLKVDSNFRLNSSSGFIRGGGPVLGD